MVDASERVDRGRKADLVFWDFKKAFVQYLMLD